MPRDDLDSLVDRILFAVCNNHDRSELWGHMRQDPDSFRRTVRYVLEHRIQIKAVDECGLCTFVDDGSSMDPGFGWTCHAEYTDEGWPRRLGLSAPTTPPAWCPLRRQPILVALKPSRVALNDDFIAAGVIFYESTPHDSSTTLEIVDESDKVRIRIREPRGKASIFMTDIEIDRLQKELVLFLKQRRGRGGE